ncbi:hypothetical protein [Nevskia sp.]|uniref:hypothetical protein n=1 Tax=Nevskia sp. TaxID=1929292 RepID=UPI0025DFC243|nr:hypothetical protein [Nevskia sp.]
MELRPAFQIPAIIKSLSDVVLPAVDPANKLAQEQGQLVVAMLHLIAQRLPLQYRYDRHELSRYLALADALAGAGAAIPEAADALHALAASAAEGRLLMAAAGTEPAALEAANLALRERVGAVVTAAAATAQDVALKAINAAVMAHTQEELLRERAWIALQGWEGPASGLPAIETLIGS